MVLPSNMFQIQILELRLWTRFGNATSNCVLPKRLCLSVFESQRCPNGCGSFTFALHVSAATLSPSLITWLPVPTQGGKREKIPKITGLAVATQRHAAPTILSWSGGVMSTGPAPSTSHQQHCALSGTLGPGRRPPSEAGGRKRWGVGRGATCYTPASRGFQC